MPAVARPGGGSAGEGPDGVGSTPTATLVAEAAPPSAHARRPLGEMLVERRKVTDGDVAWAVGQQEEDEAEGRPRRLLGELLVERGVMAEPDVLTTVAEQLGLQVAELRRETPDPSLVELIEEEQARELAVIPLRRTDAGIVVAAADPAAPGLSETLVGTFGEAVVIRVAGRSDLERAQNRAFKALSNVAEHIKVFEARAETLRSAEQDLSTQVDENAPVVQVVSLIISQAVRDRASDVHIEPMGERVRIRNRVDGALHEVLSLPQSMALALASRIKIMAGLNIVERRRPQDGQIEFSVDGRDLDIRVSTTSTVHGEKTVLRILDKTQTSYGLRDLGMPEEVDRTFEEIIRSPYGMVICAGPTGSGKTTTLYAALTEINNEEINVMTVEDPVEYVFTEINQIQINEQAGVTFAGGLRSILRQDPDAILVGEIRDVETARIAIQAALTGHFVLSTIHATDATSALHRFIDMGIESFLIASSMLAMVGQRLVRRICPECKVEYTPTEEELGFFDSSGEARPERFFHGAGCAYCADTGYYGRIGVYEVLRITDEMKQLLVESAPHAEMKALAIKQGMIPLREQALRLSAAGETTIAEVLRTIYVL